MKKLLLTITAIIYMAASTGIAMDVHYCMGKLAGVEYFSKVNDKCGRCGMKEVGKNGCCHDEHKFVKLEDSHKNVFNTIDFTVSKVAVVTEFPVFNWQVPTPVSLAVINNHSPPKYTSISSCILNCVFRL